MSLRNELAEVLARDSRYSFYAYAFVLEALEYTKTLKKKKPGRVRGRPKAPYRPNHVSGRELCDGFRILALEHYGLMALSVLSLWGIHSTSDIGEIIYNLIASGDLEKTPSDLRSDFNNVFDFEDAFRRNFVLPMDDVA